MNGLKNNQCFESLSNLECYIVTKNKVTWLIVLIVDESNAWAATIICGTHCVEESIGLLLPTQYHPDQILGY